KIILQQAIDRTQVVKLLETGKTDLLEKFISKRGRPFKAFLILDKGGQVGFEFEPRKKAAKDGTGARKKEPAPKIDFTGQQPLGKCPRCGGQIFQSDTYYLCERSQADSRPCKFKVGKTILQQPIDTQQLGKLISNGRTDMLDHFISKTGRPFCASLVL